MGIENKSKATLMVEELYRELNHLGQREAENMKVSFSTKVTDITMLDAIASHFEQTRTSIISELLSSIVLEMYFALNMEDKEKLSEIADKETTAIYDKKGITQFYSGVGLERGETTAEDMNWRSFTSMVKLNEEKRNADS